MEISTICAIDNKELSKCKMVLPNLVKGSLLPNSPAEFFLKINLITKQNIKFKTGFWRIISIQTVSEGVSKQDEADFSFTLALSPLMTS